MRTSKHFTEQKTIVETYINYNTVDIPGVNYKKTSHLWAMDVSKWAGVKISIEAFEAVCKEFDIKSKEIAQGVNVYALKNRKI